MFNPVIHLLSAYMSFFLKSGAFRLQEEHDESKGVQKTIFQDFRSNTTAFCEKYFSRSWGTVLILEWVFLFS